MPNGGCRTGHQMRRKNRKPGRFFGFMKQAEVDLMQEFISFLQIAANAGCHHIGPTGFPAPAAGYNVIIGQLMGRVGLVAVLTGVIVPVI